MTTIADLARVGFKLGDPAEIALLRRAVALLREDIQRSEHDPDNLTRSDLEYDITVFLTRYDRGAPMAENVEANHG